MTKKDKRNLKNFKLEERYGSSIQEARMQEMESILPGFYTQCEGKIIKSKPITTSKSK